MPESRTIGAPFDLNIFSPPRICKNANLILTYIQRYYNPYKCCAFSLYALCLCGKQKGAQIEEKIIDFAQLGEYIDQPVRTYSSGMKMRLGFAINVNIDPDILVVDEALSVGDKKFKQKCKNKINEIIKSGVTVLFVSHSMESVREICPRAIYLKKGEIMYDGKMEEALSRYNSDKK